MRYVGALGLVAAIGCGGTVPEKHDSACVVSGNPANGASDCCSGAFDSSYGNCCTPDNASAVNSNGSDCCSFSGANPAGACCAESDTGCHPVCHTDQDCVYNTSYPSCSPEYQSNALVSGSFICNADDGLAYDGCTGALTTCGQTFDCWEFTGVKFCAESCRSDTDCTNGGCCDTAGKCDNDFLGCTVYQNTDAGAINLLSATGACLPCGSF